MTTLVSLHLQATGHPEQLRHELMLMAACAERDGVLRQEICEIPDQAGSFLVTSLWPDEQTYRSFQRSSAHAERAARIRQFGHAVAVTLGTLIFPPADAQETP